LASRPRARDLGINIGRVDPGPLNAITDVPGIRVGHTTLIEGSGKLIPGQGPIRTGVTAIIPHEGDLFLEKVTAAVHRINGFGEVTNSEQVYEMGFIEGPIMITNTFNVARVADAVIDWSLEHSQAMGIDTWGISPIVAETSDLWLNDIRGRHVHREHVFHAIDSAVEGPVEEGAVGGGTGMICFDFKGGIGTASRRLPDSIGGYTVGVLAQTNFGWRPQLMIAGVPVGRELLDYEPRVRPAPVQAVDGGSVIVVLATDAPCSYRQLTRLAVRVANGLARTGSHTGNTSGDFVIAFSTTRRKHHYTDELTYTFPQINENGDLINHMFWSVVEATEEAVLNSLFKSDTMIGRDERLIAGLPIEETVDLMHKYGHQEVHLP
jgi:D-aminopeptidase